METNDEKKYRVRMTIELEIEVPAYDENKAFHEADQVTFADLRYNGEYGHWMINKQIEVVGEAKPQEDDCSQCYGGAWDDLRGCAKCGNLNPDNML